MVGLLAWRVLAAAGLYATAVSAADSVVCCSDARDFLRGIYGSRTAQTPVRLEAGKKKLFIDDEELDGLKGLQRALHPPKKFGTVIRADQPWDGNIQTRTGPSWNPEKKVWMIWYWATGGTAYATSKDGIHWEKPILRIHDYKGSKENNLLPLHLSFVFYDSKDADASRRYKAFVSKPDVTVNSSGFCPAVSADGLEWKVLYNSCVPSSDEANVYRDNESGLFVFAVKHAGPYGRSVYLALSRDFEHWTDPRDCLIFHADKRDQDLGRTWIEQRFSKPGFQRPEFNIPAEYSVQVYNMALFRYADIYFGLPAMFHQTGRVSKDWPGFDKYELPPEIVRDVHLYGDWTGFHHLQLVASRNLVDWERLGGRQPFIDASPPGEDVYDVQTIMPTSPPIVRDNEIWFYYTGLRRYAYVSSAEKNLGGICLAKLRLDGFVSLDAGEAGGEVTTKPMIVDGRSLHVNLDAGAGDLRVEVLDAAGQHALPGFSLKESVPVRGDHIDTQLRWRGAEVSMLTGKTVRLRFALRKASLYAFWASGQ